LFLAIAAYLFAIGFLTWLWQRKRLATRGALLVLGALVTGAASAGYLHFSRGGHTPDGVLLSSTVLESSADGYVEAQANLALFSTQPRQYNLRMERGWMDLTPVSNRPREPQEAAVVRQEGGVSRYQQPLREWDYRLFRLRFIDRFPLRADFEVQGDKLTMKIDNQSAKDLTDCWLLVPGQKYPIGDILRGARLNKEFSLAVKQAPDDSRLGRSETVNFREVTFPNKTRDILFHSSFFSRDGEARWSGDAAVFFGWVKDPAPRVHIDDTRIQTQDYALFRAVIPLSRGEEE
jgi:hypothetical protein